MPLRSIMLPSEARRPDLGAEPKRFGGERKRRRTAHEGSERALCQTGIDTNPCSPIFEPSLSWTGIDIGRAQGAIPAASGRTLPPSRGRQGPCAFVAGFDGKPRSEPSKSMARPPSTIKCRHVMPGQRNVVIRVRRRGARRIAVFRQNPPKEADRLAGANARGSPSGHASIDSTRSMSS